MGLFWQQKRLDSWNKRTFRQKRKKTYAPLHGDISHICWSLKEQKVSWNTSKTFSCRDCLCTSAESRNPSLLWHQTIHYFREYNPYRIHGTTVHLQIHGWLIFYGGTYTSPMGHMGASLHSKWLLFLPKKHHFGKDISKKQFRATIILRVLNITRF